MTYLNYDSRTGARKAVKNGWSSCKTEFAPLVKGSQYSVNTDRGRAYTLDMEQGLDLYGILGLDYGASIDTIRNSIKRHYKSGKITPQLNPAYNRILEIISVPEKKDLYDEGYLKEIIKDHSTAMKVWRVQRHCFEDYYKLCEANIDAPTKEIRNKM